jgi:hypothetical protein
MVDKWPTINLNKWSLLRWLKLHKEKERCAVFRPLLTEEHKQARLRYVNENLGATIGFEDEAWEYLWSKRK